MRRALIVATIGIIAPWALFAESVWAHVGTGIDVDQQGRVYFADTIRNRIWRIEASGQLTSLAAGIHTNFLVVAEDGNAYVVHGDFSGARQWTVWQITLEGRMTETLRSAKVEQVLGELLTIDRYGNLYFLRESQILMLVPEGRVSTLTGSGHPHYKAWGVDGSLYVARDNSIRKVSLDGTVSTLAGSPAAGFANGQGSKARFERPLSLAVDAQGNVYVADYGNRRVRKITPDDQVTTVARAGWLWYPSGVAAAAGDVYVLEYQGDYHSWTRPALSLVADLIGTPRVRKISPDGTITTIATVANNRTRTLVGAGLGIAILVLPPGKSTGAS